MWTTALLYRLFGVSEFWARSVAAISGIGLVATTYFLGGFVYSKRVGIYGALVLLTCYHFLSFSRFGTDGSDAGILSKTEVARLSADYEINVLAEINPLVYATIRRKG